MNLNASAPEKKKVPTAQERKLKEQEKKIEQLKRKVSLWQSAAIVLGVLFLVTLALKLYFA